MQAANAYIIDSQEEIIDFPGEKFLAFAHEHGVDPKLFYIFAGYEGIYDPQKALEVFNACKLGTAESLTSWAKNCAEQSGMLEELPENVRPYFDYAAWARDAEQNGDIWIIELYEDEIAVFQSQHNKKALQ